MSASLSDKFVPCLNPATLSGLPLREFLAVAAGAGFPTVEVSIQQAQAHGTGPLRDLLQELGLTVAAASGILPAGPVLPAPLLVDPDTYRACLHGPPTRRRRAPRRRSARTRMATTRRPTRFESVSTT
ncbi:hypothetical protein GCM10010377_55960 [Streptomyces viridiviolaceus]|uniref:Uncharacterized protein n=1 Tax=Streptomyces viridiviolaceus TaxID=68282 RepID=A0ABW2E5Q1_9ACTN|nr:hypothetical protein [Streptomyces viridiviolaceus]GHB57717.1 hypothetical protein GCM10010377_55960 [Streptomyces viridiviolaceus]